MNTQRPNGHWMSDEFYATHAMVEELDAILGPGWAIARKTPTNLARYRRCVTMTEYLAAQAKAIAERTKS